MEFLDYYSIEHGGMRKKKLTGTFNNFTYLAKYYQFPVFYRREIELWNENPDYKGIPLQMYIFLNRLEYVNKLPDELSIWQIMSAMTISGVMKGYSRFNAKLMDKFCKKYNIKSLYDPCSGWGERALYCFYNNIKYFGIDVNMNLFKGYREMVEDLKMTNVSLNYGESSSYDLKDLKTDATFTCPPYYNTEIYSVDGIENYSLDNFLDWWNNVIENSKSTESKYFAFQINQKYKEMMSEIVIKNGFKFIEEIKDKKIMKSHFTPNKKEYESVMIFERI